MRRKENGETIGITDMQSGDWGIYLGQHDGRHVVMLNDLFYRTVGVADYATLEDAKHEWRLD